MATRTAFLRLRPPNPRLLGVRYASRLRPSSRDQSSNFRGRVPASRGAQQPQDGQSSQVPPSDSNATDATASNSLSVSEVLKSTDPGSNTLLAPVHIPEDPNAVLKERHPAASILANSGLVIQRQLEMMNVFLGFEQANRYVIMDAQGNHVGYMAEHDGGIGKSLARQAFRTHRAFTTHIFDRSEREVLRFHRPFSWINSKIRVYDPVEVATSSVNTTSTSLTTTAPGTLIPGLDPQNPHISPLALSEMRIIGETQQVWAPLRRKYNLFLFHDVPGNQPSGQHFPTDPKTLSSSQQLQLADQTGGGQYVQFAAVDEPFLSWDFSLVSADKQLIGSVNRNFVGFARELFTDTGVYALRMDSAGLQPQESTQESNELVKSVPAMTLDQRAVMLSTAVSIDFDYFSRHSGHGGFIPIPLWMGGGEAAGAGAAGAAGTAEATGAVIGGEAMAGAGAGALGRVAGASGAGEGAMAGAGAVAGYEMMQRGRDGQPVQPDQQFPDQYPPSTPPPEGQVGQEEQWWNESEDPWNQQGGDQGGGGGGGDGGDGSWLDNFF